MFDALKDGLAIALIAVGFAAGAIVHAAIYIWNNSVPEDKPKGDEQHSASIEQFPAVYATFAIALIGIVSGMALCLGRL